jgi:two-component system sensor histidine kinase BaeS
VHVAEDGPGAVARVDELERLRLLVGAFEIWLGLLVALVLLAGVALRGRWLPRVALVGGVLVLLVLAALNPDAYVAQRNVERFERTGRVDWVYLRRLSADAVPALDRLPEPYRSCTLAGVAPAPDGDLLAWNLGRDRAAGILRSHPVDQTPACGSLPFG